MISSKNVLFLVLVGVVLCALLVSCVYSTVEPSAIGKPSTNPSTSVNPSTTAKPSTNDETEPPSVSDKVPSNNGNKEGNDNVEYFNSKAELTESFGVNFADIELTDIQYYYDYLYGNTNIIVFGNGSEVALQSLEFEQYEIDELLPEDIMFIERLGVEKKDLQKYGISLTSVEVDGDVTTRSIECYQLNKSHDKGNILLFTSLPYKVEVDVDKIMNE